VELPDIFDSSGSELMDHNGSRFRIDDPEFFDRHTEPVRSNVALFNVWLPQILSEIGVDLSNELTAPSSTDNLLRVHQATDLVH
jgi:hypothetical protein